MINKKVLFLTVIIVLVVIAFYVLRTKNFELKKTIPLHNKSTEKLIILDKNGFTPKDMTIKNGVAIRWINKTGSLQSVNSDKYPTNQLHKELNFGTFNNGSSFVYVFKKTGIYGYHNHLNPKQSGKITVTE